VAVPRSPLKVSAVVMTKSGSYDDLTSPQQLNCPTNQGWENDNLSVPCHPSRIGRAGGATKVLNELTMQPFHA